MLTAGLMVPLVFAYVGVGAFAIAITEEIHEAIFWPIVLAKFLLKSLYLVLFTGWKL